MTYATERYSLSSDPIRAPSSAGQAGKVARGAALFAAIFGAIVGATFLSGWAAPGELIWPLSPDVYAAATFFAVLTVLACMWRLYSRRDRTPMWRGAPMPMSRRIDGAVFGPAVLVLWIFRSAPVLVQAAGFVGLHPAAVTVEFQVTGKDVFQRRHDSRDHYRLALRYGAYGRVFDDEVRQSVYDTSQPGDTVVLPVETGRFGLQRALVAGWLAPADLHHPAAGAR